MPNTLKTNDMNNKIFWAGELYDTATIDEGPINRSIKITHTINHSNPKLALSQYTTLIYCRVEKIHENGYKLSYKRREGSLCPDCISKIYPEDAKIILDIDDQAVEKLYHSQRTSFNRQYIHYETFMEAFQRESKKAGASEARYISIAVSEYEVELTLYFEPYF
ncbi:MAG: hypothetical protein SNJ29_14850 [Rikenellaceae bacterium]